MGYKIVQNRFPFAPILHDSFLVFNKNNQKINSILLKSTFKFSVSHPQFFWSNFWSNVSQFILRSNGSNIFVFFGLFFFYFLDPPCWVLWIHACLSVSQSASHKSYDTSHHRISLILHTKLQSNEWRKVTKPDFRRKKCASPIPGQTGPSRALTFFVHFLEFASLVSIAFHIMMEGHVCSFF